MLELGGDEGAALAGLAKISRDNARTPMQWDAEPNAGFTTGDPWLPVNPNYTWLNAAAQIDATDSVFAHYQALIRLRHELPILVDGDFTPLMAEDPQIWAYTRTTPDRKLLVIANCGRDPRTVEIGREWIGGRSAARQPARHPGHVDVNVPATWPAGTRASTPLAVDGPRVGPNGPPAQAKSPRRPRSPCRDLLAARGSIAS